MREVAMQLEILKRRPGRPRGSKNKKVATVVEATAKPVYKLPAYLKLKDYLREVCSYGIEETTLKARKNAPMGYIYYIPKIGSMIYTHATSNCQLLTISSFNAILGLNNKDDIQHLLAHIYFRTNKRIALVDIKVEDEKFIKAHIDTSSIRSRTEYTSTNNSKMVIYLIDIVHYFAKHNVKGIA